MDERVRELLDRVRGTALTVSEAAGTTARYAAKCAGQTVDIAKLNMKIFDLKSDINNLLREVEIAKLRCAAAHFAAVSGGCVQFEAVTDLNELIGRMF